MKIHNHGVYLLKEHRLFEEIAQDISSRNLPDVGFYRTFRNGLQWDGQQLETLSALMPEDKRILHFAIVCEKKDDQEKWLLLFISTTGGQIDWRKEAEFDTTKIANASFLVCRTFLEQTKQIRSDKQAVMMLYPAFGVPIPDEVKEQIDVPLAMHRSEDPQL